MYPALLVFTSIHTLYLGGSNCPTIALSESLDMSPPMHQDSRKNRGKNAPLGIFCQINFYGENEKKEKQPCGKIVHVTVTSFSA